jgi:hypothetical protein
LVLDKYNTFIYPRNEFLYAVTSNIVSKSHIKDIKDLHNVKGTLLILYTDVLKVKNESIVWQKNRLDKLIERMKNKVYYINNKLIASPKSLKTDIGKEYEDFVIFHIFSIDFSVLIYYNKNLVHWEYQRPDSTNCVIVKLKNSDYISKETGYYNTTKQIHLINQS